MDEQELRSIQVLALRAVEEPSYEDIYERICRWYSRSFSTPLAEVREMAEADVLRVYFEEQYLEAYTSTDEKDAKRYDDIRDRLLADPDDVAASEMDDEAWVRQMAEEVKKSEEAVKAAAGIPKLVEDKGSFRFDDSDK